MVNVFTVQVPYKTGQIPALVTLRNRGGYESLSVQFFDSDINNLLPDGVLHMNLSNQVRKTAQQAVRIPRDLVLSVTEAIRNQRRFKDSEGKLDKRVTP